MKENKTLLDVIFSFTLIYFGYTYIFYSNNPFDFKSIYVIFHSSEVSIYKGWFAKGVAAGFVGLKRGAFRDGRGQAVVSQMVHFTINKTTRKSGWILILNQWVASWNSFSEERTVLTFLSCIFFIPETPIKFYLSFSH